MAEEAADAATPVEYRVMQGPLFKKPGTDPATDKIVQIKKKVGATVKTTGRTWTGKSGGEWIELAESPDVKPGWLLIEGPGFNLPGPLLEKVEPGEEEVVVLTLWSLITSSALCEVCVKPTHTISKLKWWVALRDPHKLKPHKVLVAKEMPNEQEAGSFSIAQFPGHKLHADGTKIADSAFKSGDKVPYFYMGEASDDGAFNKD
eukprot:gnl/TRDRNA2_/TRDRNA2_83075_c0_seq2.p1 gnl/TRDRNA2_/TRDRNA2_83075_c0~~gnl/TRDRNA2_/TRDRNA2_83075_c0_seq2.p1  ORF type:complete len:204 (+),score=47.80 gnl/TRDRNA2_/TRDRNA2_83075_c0_seq2:52-663(+)